MKKILNAICNVAAALAGRRRTMSKDSALMGMYLSQTNSKHMFASEFQESRQRRNGKYSLTRDRD